MKPAKGVRGHILLDPIRDRYFFRVYGEPDPQTGRKRFTDYRIDAEDIEVTVESGLGLYESADGNRLDWVIPHGSKGE